MTSFYANEPPIPYYIDKLDALVWQHGQPVPADPFAGLTGGPVPVEQPF